MDEMMSEAASDTRLNVPQECFFALQSHVGTDVQEPLRDLMIHPKEELDNASYMKLMYTEGLCYKKQGNKSVARYCATRMYAIQERMRNPRKKHPRLLDLQEHAYSDAMNAFIERCTAFPEGTYRGIDRRLLMIADVLSLAVFLVLTLFLEVYLIIAVLGSIMLGMLTYLLQKRRIPDTFQENQLNTTEGYVEQEVLELNRSTRFF